MKNPSLFLAGLAVAIMSVLPANAEAARTASKPALTPSSDNTLKGSHSECLAMAVKIGWSANEVSRYCSYHEFRS
jgi:hypothetical protein